MKLTTRQQQRIHGALWGALVGDALGVPVEFSARDELQAHPVTGMRGGVATHWEEPAGTWSDDGAMMLCTAKGLAQHGLDTEALGQLFLRWYHEGYLTATGKCFDTGATVQTALTRIKAGMRAEKAGPAGTMNNGNGSLMRILPVPIWAASDDQFGFVDAVTRVAHITHGHPLATAACVFYGMFVRNILVYDSSPMYAYHATIRTFDQYLAINDPQDMLRCEFQRILSNQLQHQPQERIYSGGYVMDTLTAALWCFLTTHSYEECVLKAVNLGGDTDTTACVAGGLAGLYYGLAEIPDKWLIKMPRGHEVDTLISDFYMAVEKHWETGV